MLKLGDIIAKTTRMPSSTSTFLYVVERITTNRNGVALAWLVTPQAEDCEDYYNLEQLSDKVEQGHEYRMATDDETVAFRAEYTANIDKRIAQLQARRKRVVGETSVTADDWIRPFGREWSDPAMNVYDEEPPHAR